MAGNEPGDVSSKGGIGDALRRVRWRMRRTEAGLRYGKDALQTSPVLFGNSFPKSGTHLLAQVLQAFPKIGLAVDRGMGPVLTYVPSTGRRRTSQELLGELCRLGPGDMAFGHVIADPEILAGWPQGNAAHFFMLRDLRDVVISHAYFISSKAFDHVHNEYYRSLPTLEDRIRTSILGRPDWEGEFPSIRQRFELYMGWLDHPDVCVLKFEDFIANRDASLTRMLEYAVERGFRLRLDAGQAIDNLSNAIDPKRSYTFRSGKTGEWRTHFTEEHIRQFKEIAGDLLIRLGYEGDEDW